MSPHPRITETRRLTELLLFSDIDFILAGDTAALAHGSAHLALDYQVVCSPSESNVERVLLALSDLGACTRPEHDRQPTGKFSEARDAYLLSTRLGPMDVLRQLPDGRGYDELLSHSVTMDAGVKQLRVLDLPTLIEVKTVTRRLKDKLIVPELIALLERASKDAKG